MAFGPEGRVFWLPFSSTRQGTWMRVDRSNAEDLSKQSHWLHQDLCWGKAGTLGGHPNPHASQVVLQIHAEDLSIARSALSLQSLKR